MSIYYMRQLTKSKKVEVCTLFFTFYFILQQIKIQFTNKFFLCNSGKFKQIISSNGGSPSNDKRVFNN